MFLSFFSNSLQAMSWSGICTLSEEMPLHYLHWYQPIISKFIIFNSFKNIIIWLLLDMKLINGFISDKWVNYLSSMYE